MINRKLSIPCLDAACNIADGNLFDENCKEIEDCIKTARNLKIPYVRIHAGTSVTDGDLELTVKCLEKMLPVAEKADVTILLETVGLFATTEKLRDVLNFFASDNLGALWDMYHTYFSAGEDPDSTIKNLGAYVKHVHIKDSTRKDGKLEYCLIGEGDMPVSDMMNSLRAVNYDGFISLEWDPKWLAEIDDIEVVFAHFVSFMHHFDDPKKNKKTLYSNKLHTGKFLWKKESLIDLTFPQVLDAVVEEFPDQIAFKYTTLDYTRTYSEFRDDGFVLCNLKIQKLWKRL
jgi:fatty-acyl-CoA synthase